MTARVVIVRHGNTFAPGELPRRIGAATDLPLVESGRAQARALATYFTHAGLTFDRVLSSPLLRTRETAATIVQDRRVEDAEWLREIDHGPDEDRSEQDLLARIGHAALDAWDQHAIAPPGWRIDAPKRIAAWQAFLADATGTSLVVTSNGAARFALLALALAPAKIRTGAYGMLDGPPWAMLDWDRRPD